MLKPILIAVALAGSVLPAAAHNFWLQPADFHIDKPGGVQVHAMVGHKDDLSAWATRPTRVISLNSVGPGGVIDQRLGMIGDPAQGLIAASLPIAGLHILTLTSTHAVSELPAGKFNDYVAQEGVLPILEDRRSKGTMKKPGREIYSRRGKSLLLVGNLATADDAHVTRPLGMTLEIIPLQNPMRVDPATGFEFEVRFLGKLVPGATVHFVRLDKELDDMAPLLTGKNGRATFAAPEGGVWMLQTVWSTPIQGDPRAEYDTTFSSFTFDFGD